MALVPPLEPLLKYPKCLDRPVDDGGISQGQVRYSLQMGQVVSPHVAGRGTMASEEPAPSKDAYAKQTVKLSSEAPTAER